MIRLLMQDLKLMLGITKFTPHVCYLITWTMFGLATFFSGHTSTLSRMRLNKSTLQKAEGRFSVPVGYVIKENMHDIPLALRTVHALFISLHETLDRFPRSTLILLPLDMNNSVELPGYHYPSKYDSSLFPAIDAR